MRVERMRKNENNTKIVCKTTTELLKRTLKYALACSFAFK